MAKLVIGPTCVGKSTFLSSEQARDFGIAANTFKLGFQLASHPAQRGETIHYNLLRDTQPGASPVASPGAWSLEQDRVLSELLNVGILTECLVLVAPVQELVRRAKARTMVEADRSWRYDSSFWVSALERTDLFRAYEQLFDLLEQAGVPARVLDCSSPVAVESDRVFVHSILRGHGAARPDKAIVNSIIEDTRLHYQSILLPYGRRTEARNASHLPTGRQSTFEKVFPESLQEASVLDIGCAIGELLFAAERRGASTLVGIEPKKDRYEAAKLVAGILRSHARFVHGDFASFNDVQTFDHIYLLNVLHHVSDVDSFLRKAASLARKSITIEIATLLDQKFRDQHGLDRSEAIRLNELPVIGVSSLRRADQTYVHSPAAIEKLMRREAAAFEMTRLCDSPIPDRKIMVFQRL